MAYNCRKTQTTQQSQKGACMGNLGKFKTDYIRANLKRRVKVFQVYMYLN